MAARRIPPNFYGFSFGLSGLSETWAIAAHAGRAPHAVGVTIAAVSGVVWLAVTAAYLRYAWSDRTVLQRDLLDPIAGPFLALAVISPMIFDVVGIFPYAPFTGKVLFDIFLVLTLLLGGWFTGQWIYAPLEIDKVHPGYFLPTVAGGLVASDGAALVGEHTLSEVMFGFGVVSWLVMGSIILGRLFVRPVLPTPLLPTLAIEVAPAAVASLAWLDAHGDRIDVVAAFLAGYGLLMVVAQLRLIATFMKLRFMPSTWAFTFSWAAVASATLHWIIDQAPPFARGYEYIVLAAISLFIGAIGARTVLAVTRSQLFPAPPAPAVAVPAATSGPAPTT